ncbi:hypothetical protein [Aeromicrobium sp. Leaf350]|uniref:hypothetical protein n=1 Tax=Aeromicrobium sp. Leaf350 TaxID=2876565 RepID=UPI001E51A446|nr:hypothetical protein [Aeromicrobium sp. Leaf350]
MSDGPSLSDRATGWAFLVCGALLPIAVAGRWATTGEPLWAESSRLVVNLAAPTLMVVMTALLLTFGAVVLEWTSSLRAVSATLVLTLVFIALLGAMCLVAPSEMVGQGRGAPRTETAAVVTGVVLLTAVGAICALSAAFALRRRSRDRQEPVDPEA